MFRSQNLNNKLFGNFNLYNISTNTLQHINLAKHDIYPHFNNSVMRDTQTTLIINSGKLLINLYDAKINKEISLFAENDCLCGLSLDDDKSVSNNAKMHRDVVYTNKKYALYIYPNIFYKFYSFDNSNFQMMFNSNRSINYYTFNKINNYFVSSTEYL